jgi:hypothetical protein
LLKYLLPLVFVSGFATAQEVQNAPGGVLRALDKTSGQTKDFEMRAGATVSIGNLKIVMSECRYPRGNPSGNAYAALEVSETGKEGVVFSGWMIASAPAVSAMEHPRYDVWIMRCITS